MITKQQLENAARAFGLQVTGWTDEGVSMVKHQKHGVFLWGLWNPLDPTKTDLMGLMLALNPRIEIYENYVIVMYQFFKNEVNVINGDKHAALAEAVVSVASQIWESKL
jgi:hypothetical protein